MIEKSLIGPPIDCVLCWRSQTGHRAWDDPLGGSRAASLRTLTPRQRAISLARRHQSFTQFGFDKYQHMRWHNFTLRARKLGRNYEEEGSERDERWWESSDAPCGVRLLRPAGFTEHSADADIKMCDLSSYATSICKVKQNFFGHLLKNVLQARRFRHLMEIKARSRYVTR